jgi:DNA-binding NtrC family response regulator
VVAGQQPLIEAVQAGRFRADLMGRIDGLTVQLPPLRQRREDVLPLFSHLLESIGRAQAPAFESDLAERLCLHDWPFNVRELVLLVRRLLALHGSEATLKAQHLPERLGENVAGAGSSKAPTSVSSRASADAVPAGPVQLPALVVALRTSGGNVARAAAILGISRQRAYRLMDGQGIDLEAIRGDSES